ncbi:MAG: ABC-2 transporter permease [Butyrivibrio sp.]|nr:ABC-2 transporter permease [Butyrivibrio sp.]
MLGLIEKDLRLTLIKKQTIVIFLVMALAMGVSMNGAFLVAYLTMLAMIIGTGTISYDEYDNGLPFLMTLPFDRKTYVREKYLFSLITAIVAWFIGAVIFGIMDVVRNNGAGLSEIPAMIAIIPAIYIASAIIIPLQLKYGGEKSRIALSIIFGLVAVIAVGVGKVTENPLNPMADVISALQGLPGYAALIILLAVSAVATTISYLFSVKIMEKKEF